MATGIICVVLIVICIFGIKSTVKRFAYGCCGSGQDAVKKIPCRDPEISHYPFSCIVSVEGMSCKNCVGRVENAFHESDNFFAEADLGKQQVKIHMKEKVTEQELRRIIRGAGYTPGDCGFDDAP